MLLDFEKLVAKFIMNCFFANYLLTPSV